MRKSFTLVLVLAAVGILFRHRFWDSSPSSNSGMSANVSPGASPNEPSNTTSNEKDEALVLYDPDSEGADASWGRPALLDTPAILSLTNRVSNLEKKSHVIANNLSHLYDEQMKLSDQKYQNMLFERLNGPGFKDKDLPLAWHKVASDQEALGSHLLGWSAGVAGSTAVFLAAQNRIDGVKSDLIGGHITVGDTLFVDGYEKFTNRQNERVNTALTEIGQLFQRFWTEFPQDTLTYYDTNGIEVKPWDLVHVEHVTELQHDLNEFTSSYDFYKRRRHNNRERQLAISKMREFALNVHDPEYISLLVKIVDSNGGTDAIVNDDSPQFVFDDLCEIHFQGRIKAGTVSSDDVQKMRTRIAAYRKNVAEDKQQHDLELQFVEEAFDHHHESILIKNTDGDIRDVWGDHLNETSRRRGDDPDLP